MSSFLITVYVIELIIFSLFDTRTSSFSAFLNMVALVGATYFTFVEFGFSWMLLVPTLGALILGGILGGIIAGLKSKHTAAEQHIDG
jgi:hypothetical protein